jgi:hypothetical protein
MKSNIKYITLSIFIAFYLFSLILSIFDKKIPQKELNITYTEIELHEYYKWW